MKIGIDANEANVSRRVGISEYAYQVIQQLYKMREEGKNDHHYTIFLKSNPIDVLPKQTSWWKYKVVKPSKMWTQIGLPMHLFLKERKLDVFFTTSHYAPRFSPIPTVVSVMDVSYLRFPETFKKNDLYQLVNWTKYSVEAATKVITISESSKNDIIKYYKVPSIKVNVVYLGLKDLPKSMASSKNLTDFGVTKPFVLFVGTLQPRKNIHRLIEAFSKLPSHLKSSHQLVVIGKKGWLYDEILEAPKKYGILEETVFLDYVSDEDLPQFYKKAEVYVLPSLYEGFGLPVLEAMRYGCPVITSNISSLPEAGGNAALYFDPESVSDIEKTLEKVLTDKKLREKMIEKGTEHYKKFTWEKAAKEVLDTLEAVGENK